LQYRNGLKIQPSQVIEQIMSNSEDESNAKSPRAKTAAKYYFLTVWAVCLVTFVVGEFNPVVRTFIFTNFWWFVIAIGLAICSAPLLFPRGVTGLARDLKEYQRRTSRGDER
jgi:hypothetical protein